MKKRIFVVSDLHLGFDGKNGSNRNEFDSFIQSLQAQSGIEQHLVLLGDIFDMWRRDASGIFLESQGTIENILALRSKGFKIHFIAGNHDHHLLFLKDHSYPFEFLPWDQIEDPPFTYLFYHGHEFDATQNEYVMEMLCRFMSDEVGSIQNVLWEKFNVLRYRISTWSILGIHNLKVKNIKMVPELRLSEEQFEAIEKKAFNCVRNKPNTILVFGHTHRPFIIDNERENLVNSGSWVGDKEDKDVDTYVVLFDGKPKILKWPKGVNYNRRTVK